jgi:hypothetical protein
MSSFPLALISTELLVLVIVFHSLFSTFLDFLLSLPLCCHFSPPPLLLYCRQYSWHSCVCLRKLNLLGIYVHIFPLQCVDPVFCPRTRLATIIQRSNSTSACHCCLLQGSHYRTDILHRDVRKSCSWKTQSENA